MKSFRSSTTASAGLLQAPGAALLASRAVSCRTGCRNLTQKASSTAGSGSADRAVPGNPMLNNAPRQGQPRTALLQGTASLDGSARLTPQVQGTAAGRAPYSTEASKDPEPIIHDVFEDKTGTWQYVVADPSTSRAAIIDAVLDFDPVTRKLTTTSADALLSLVKDLGYKLDWILETHAHADHLTSAAYLKRRLAGDQGYQPTVGIGKRITGVQTMFSERYGVSDEVYAAVFDKLFDDDEVFDIGTLRATAMHLPGHTPDHLGYKIGDNVFCGDSIFHADIGTARCDFPGGSASQLFTSGRRLLSLPDHVKIWTGHDYPPEGRSAAMPWMTVRDHREQNKHLKDGVTEEEFVALRNERDSKLGEPRLLHQSLQVNIRGGQLPKPEPSGYQMLHLPLNTKGLEW